MPKLRLVSWNINKSAHCWRLLASDPTIDVALLQEARRPPDDVALEVFPDRAARWHTAGHSKEETFRTAVARCSDRVSMMPYQCAGIHDCGAESLAVSREGTVTPVDVVVGDERATVISAYAFWESPHASTKSSWIYADASVHRIISDISAYIGSQDRHRVIVAGDLNILHGYGEDGSRYWKARYETIFTRMTALGLPFVGPQSPNGRQAEPRPDELPIASLNVPTYHTRAQGPAGATRQLDFVFASEALRPRLIVRALNAVEEWGPSDHCRLMIDLE